MSAPPTLTFVFPALNEAQGIERTLRAVVEARPALEGRVGAVDVVVVDDGSTDGTAQRARAVDLGVPVTVVRHEERRGLGAALRSGFAAATGDVVCYSDADLPFDLRRTAGALDLLVEDVGLVSLYRTGPRHEGPRRWLLSLGYNALARLLFDVGVRDVNCGGKLVARAALEAIALRSEGSFIDVELIARVRRAGFEVAQVGVPYQPRTTGVSTLASWAVVGGIVRELREQWGELGRWSTGRFRARCR